jgi:radical SAM superfamily enzyme YgiQ (UPF0313 family)
MVAKRNNPNIDIMVGGSLIELSNHARNLLSVLDIFDYVIKGDIENVIEKYVSDELSKDVHIVEYVDMKLLSTPIYLLPEIILKPNLYFSFSRGCPNPCSYCPGGHRGLKFLPTSKVLKVFEHYNKILNKVKSEKDKVCMFFTDNTTNFTRKRIENLCDGLIEMKNELKSDAFFTFRNLNFDILEKLAKSKFSTIKLGIDTYNEKKNHLYHNEIKYTRDDIYPVLDKIKSLKMGLYGKPGIYGMPGETREMFDEELNFLIELYTRYKGVERFVVMPYMYYFIPGTPVYNDPGQWGIIYEYWGSLNCVIPEVNEIAKKTPRYYYCNVSQEEYIYRYTKIREISTTFRCAEVEDYMKRIGHTISISEGC